MLSPLDLKLLRDIGKMKGQMVAVSVVMACGLAMMSMSRSLILSLESTRDAYYTRHRFGDVFCDVKRAPNSLRERLAEIADVAAVDTRVTGSAKLDLPGLVEPADATVISLPDDRPQQLHLLYLRRGRLPEFGRANEIVVGEAFATAHGYVLPLHDLFGLLVGTVVDRHGVTAGFDVLGQVAAHYGHADYTGVSSRSHWRRSLSVGRRQPVSHLPEVQRQVPTTGLDYSVRPMRTPCDSARIAQVQPKYGWPPPVTRHAATLADGMVR